MQVRGRFVLRWAAFALVCVLAGAGALITAQKGSADDHDTCNGQQLTIYDPIVSFNVHLPDNAQVCAVEDLENDAYIMYAGSHGLEPGDPSIVKAGQYQIAGILWALFLQIIQAHADYAAGPVAGQPDPTPLTDEEKAAYDWLHSKVNSYRLSAANDAKSEYDRWSANPCAYTTPDPQLFTFNTGSDPACTGTFASLLSGPSPPSFQELVEMGQYDADKDLYTSGGLGGSTYAALATSKILEAQGVWSTSFLGVLGPALKALLGSTRYARYVDLVRPYERKAVNRTNQKARAKVQRTQRNLQAEEEENTLAEEGETSSDVALEEDAGLAGEDLSDAGIEASGEAAATLGSESLSGPFFIAGIGIAILVQESIKIADEVKIPGELQDNINAASTRELNDLVANPDGGGFSTVFEDFLAQLDVGPPAVGTSGHVVTTAPNDGSEFEEEFADDSGTTRYTNFTPSVSLLTWPLGQDQGALGVPQENFTYYNGQLWRQIGSHSDDGLAGLAGYVPTGELHYYDWSGHPRIAMIDGNQFLDESAPGSTDVGGLDASQDPCQDALSCQQTNVIFALVHAGGVNSSYTTDVIENGTLNEVREYHPSDGSLKPPFQKVRLVLKPDPGAPALINMNNRWGYGANTSNDATPPQGGLHPGDTVTLVDPLDHPFGASTTYTWTIETRCAYQATCTNSSDSAFHGNPTVTKTGQSVTFTWPAPGVYHVRLTTLDQYGHTLTSDQDVTVTGSAPSLSLASLNVPAGGGSVLGTIHQGSPLSLTECIALPAGAYGDPKVSFDWGDGTVDTGTARGTSTSGLSFHFGTTSSCNQQWQVTATHTYTFSSSFYQVQKQLHYTFSDGLDSDPSHSITFSPVVNVIFSAPPTFTSATSTTFMAGVFSSFTFTANGSPDATITAVDTSSLPSGLGVSTNAHGVLTISGDANINGPGGDFPITLKAANGIQPDATQTFTLHIDLPPQLSGPSTMTVPAGAQLPSPITFTATTGAPTPSVSIKGNTDGMVITEGITSGFVSLSGTPAAQGTFNYTVTAENAAGTVVKPFTLVVGSLPSFTSPTSAGFVDGNGASFTVSTAGSPTATLSLTSGTLPHGLTFTPGANGTATIWGTPDTADSQHVTITATNGAGSATQNLTVTTSSTGGPNLTVSATPNTVDVEDIDPSAGVANVYSVPFVAGTPETVTVTSSDLNVALTAANALPTGLTFTDHHDGTATIVGAADASAGGIHALEVDATPNGGGTSGFIRIELKVYGPPVLTSNPVATFVAGQSGTFTLTGAGIASPRYSLVGTLPAGLSFDDPGLGTATISGTPDPSAVGTSTVQIDSENIFTVGSPVVTTQTIEVDAAPAVTSALTASFGEGAASSFRVTTSGFPNASLAVVGALPPGITFTDNRDGTGTFSGTPTDTGEVSYPVTVQATNTVTTTTQALTLNVGPLPQFIGSTQTTLLVGSSSASLDLTSFTDVDVTPVPTLSATGLPSGVTLTDHGDGTATLGGVPAPGTGDAYTIPVTATNAYGSTTENVSLVVDEAPSWRGIDFGSCSSPNASETSVPVAAGSGPTITPCVTGYPVPVLSLAGTLPEGLAFTDNNNDSATITGNVASGSGGLYPLTLTMTNAAGAATQALALEVDQSAAFTDTDPVNWVAGQSNTYVATLTGYPIDSIVPGSVPSWMSATVDTATQSVTLSGTPPLDQLGSSVNVSVSVDQHTASIGLGQGPPPHVFVQIQPFAFTAQSPPNPSIDAAYSYQFATTATDTAFALADGDTLPDGLTLSSSGLLSGTPTSIGKWAFTVVATDSAGSVSTNPIVMTVQGRSHTLDISAFRLYGPSGRGDWFVTARNMTAAAIPLYGWKVGVIQPGRSTPLLESLPAGTLAAGADVTLAGPYYSLAPVDANASIGSPIVADPGGVELVAPDGSISDKAGVTGAPASAYSGTPLPMPTGAQMGSQMAYVRNTSGGHLVDTDDNASDFTYASELRTQSVSFTSTAPASAKVGDTYTVGTTSSSTNPIALSIGGASTSGACLLSGSVVTFLAVGTCVIEANQAGDVRYAAAPTVSQAILVRATATVSTTSTVTTTVSPTTSTKTVVSSGASAVTISVPAGAVTTTATVTATVAPPSTTAGVTFSAGTVAVQLSVTSTSTAAPITHFDQPVELDFPDTSSTFVPAYSHDGVTWTEIPQITTPPTLPAAWPDGWYRDSAGVVHVLTRHATYFAILTANSKVTPALQLHFGVRSYLNLNYRRAIVVHLQPTLPAALTVTLRNGKKTVATWRAKLTTDAKALTLTLPKNARHAGNDTLVVRVTVGKELAQKTATVKLVASWHKPR